MVDTFGGNKAVTNEDYCAIVETDGSARGDSVGGSTSPKSGIYHVDLAIIATS